MKIILSCNGHEFFLDVSMIMGSLLMYQLTFSYCLFSCLLVNERMVTVARRLVSKLWSHLQAGTCLLRAAATNRRFRRCLEPGPEQERRLYNSLVDGLYIVHVGLTLVVMYYCFSTVRISLSCERTM